jgi:leucyl aminopeptidase
MVTVKVTESILHAPTRARAVCVFQDELSSLTDVAESFFPSLVEYAQEVDFTGQAGRVIAIPVVQDGSTITLMIGGLGKRVHGSSSIEQFRRLIGSLIRTMQMRRIDSCTVQLPDHAAYGVSVLYLAEQLTIIANMAAYRFQDYISEEKRRINQDLTLFCAAPAGLHHDIKTGIARGLIVGDVVNNVRHWIDLPPSTMTPAFLAAKAHAIAKDHSELKLTVFDEHEVHAMGMGGLSGVSAGSEQDCKLVIMEYTTSKADAPTLAFVGKGITFDSGGLSIKPAASMETMKDDMSGAAAVIGVMKALAQLKPDVNVIALAPIAENLPSGKATKPGDIVRFYNGKTAEVRNTDAEGRLVLADALSYAVKNYRPDAIVDIATLTGACAYALGPFFTGLMGEHDHLLKQIEHAAAISGDRVWRLPFDRDYKPAVVSDVADLCNIGKSKYKAGAITAGWFLQAFVGDTPWAHMDIAGTAFEVPDISYYDTGATGAGVRLLIELACNWSQ